MLEWHVNYQIYSISNPSLSMTYQGNIRHAFRPMFLSDSSTYHFSLLSFCLMMPTMCEMIYGFYRRRNPQTKFVLCSSAKTGASRDVH